MSIFQTRKGLAVGVLCATASLATHSLFAQEAPAKTKKNDEEPAKLEKFEVTGSRIKRLDIEGPAPVVVIDRKEIQQSGFRTLGDYVQSLPFNTGSTNSVVQTSSFTRGAATANPRGLGSNRFLALVNGRRALTYALTNSSSQSVFDFNSIPLAAVESIEYLKDGASAIYGSDAISGVMNIKLKKDYTGVSTSLEFGDTLKHDMLQRKASVLAGAQAGKTSVLVAVQYESENASFIRDFKRSESTDYTRFGDPVKGINQNSTSNYPANLNLTASQAAAAGFTTGAGLYVLTGGQPTANPKTSDFAKVAVIPNENRYDFAQSYELSPPYDRTNMYASLRHEISDKLYLFGEVIYGVSDIDFQFTPAVIQSTQNPGTGPTGLLNIPANNPYNPLGTDITNFLYRTNFGAPRGYDTNATVGTVLVGAGGELFNHWSWQAAFGGGGSEVTTVSRNQIRASDLQAALNGTTRQTALNPFGPSDNADVPNRLFTVSNSSSKVTAQSFDASISAPDVFTLFPAGGVGLALGGEARRDTLNSNPDTASYVGAGGGTPYKGSRTVKSAYTEATIPLLKEQLSLKKAELQLAARYEKYSDFGDTTKPKIALMIEPTNWLILRGSLSKSFKAPDLGQLYTAQTVAFSSTLRSDPKRPQDPATQMRIVTGGNPKLQPENADVYYGGIVVDVKKVKGLSFTADYFDIKIGNVISTPSEVTLLSREDQFPGAVVRDNSQSNPGPIVSLRRVPFNVASQEYKGMDFGAQYNLIDTPYGDFRIRTDWTRIFSLANDAGFGGGKIENVGLYNNPRWKGSARVRWQKNKLGAVVTGNYFGAYWNDGYVAQGWQENAVTTCSTEVSYQTWKDITVTVGCENLFDTPPPFNGRETSGFDQGTYGFLANGRFLFLRLEKEF